MERLGWGIPTFCVSALPMPSVTRDVTVQASFSSEAVQPTEIGRS